MLFFVMFFSFSALNDSVKKLPHTEYYKKNKVKIFSHEQNTDRMFKTMTLFHNKIIEKLNSFFFSEEFKTLSYRNKSSKIKIILDDFLKKIEKTKESSEDNDLIDSLKLFNPFILNYFTYGKTKFHSSLKLIINKIIEDLDFNLSNNPNGIDLSYKNLQANLNTLSEFNIKDYLNTDELKSYLSSIREGLQVDKNLKKTPHDSENQKNFYTYKKSFYTHAINNFFTNYISKIINSDKFNLLEDKSKLILSIFLIDFKSDSQHAFRFLLNKDQINKDETYITRIIKENKDILATYFNHLNEAYEKEYPENILNYSKFDKNPNKLLKFIFTSYSSAFYRKFYNHIFNTETKKINDQFLIRQIILYNFNLFIDTYCTN